MKNIFFHSLDKVSKRWIGAITSINIYVLTIVFGFLYVAGCKGSNSSGDNKKKTDTVFVQPSSEEGEGMDGTHEGTGDEKKENG